MVDSIVESLRGHIPPELVIFLVSLLPILELRGGMLAAALLNVPWAIAFPICVVGNMLPIPFELLFIRKIFDLLRKVKGIRKIVNKLDERARKKAESEKFQKYSYLGLFFFVAIPLPGTGAWTGGLIADILDIRIKKAFPIITVGVIVAGLIMTFITYIIPDYIVPLFTQYVVPLFT